MIIKMCLRTVCLFACFLFDDKSFLHNNFKIQIPDNFKALTQQNFGSLPGSSECELDKGEKEGEVHAVMPLNGKYLKFVYNIAEIIGRKPRPEMNS
jgi:hypothetical protein